MSANSIHPAELISAGRMLTRFADEISSLYGKQIDYLSSTVAKLSVLGENSFGAYMHSLEHVEVVVDNWGPL